MDERPKKNKEDSQSASVMLAKKIYVGAGVRRCSIDSRSEESGEEPMNRMYVLMYRGNWL